MEFPWQNLPFLQKWHEKKQENIQGLYEGCNLLFLLGHFLTLLRKKINRDLLEVKLTAS